MKPLAVASILPLTEYSLILSLPDAISYANGSANQKKKA